MLLLEADWLRARLASIPDEFLFPLLDIGSSTIEFRTRTQPYIEELIFSPLRQRGGQIFHLDAKEAAGVDIVGDLFDLKFRKNLSNLGIKAVLMSNLLEHVQDRRTICDAVLEIVPAGGYLMVTGPNRYPYHADPIDTMFRPTVEGMRAYFPGTELVDSAIIDCGSWWQLSNTERGGRSFGRTALRLLAPFYRYRKWQQVVFQVPYMYGRIKAFALVLRKTGVHA